MNYANEINLIKLSGIYFFDDNSRFFLDSGQVEIKGNLKEQFLAIAL